MKRLLILTISLLLFSFSNAQQLQRQIDSLARRLEATAPPRETSIYLRSDKDIYVAGEDCWFNAFVLDAKAAALSTLDQVLYLQLVNQQTDSITWQEMYPIVNGVAAGHVYVPHSLPPGYYLLKAYSAHSFFHQQAYFTATAPIQVVADPRHIKRYGQLTAAAPYTSGKPVRLSLAPTGGQLIAGIPNTIAFRAVDPDGIPYAVQGKLLRNDTAFLDIRSGHAGIGQFILTPQDNTRYQIRIDGAPDSLFKLPPIASSGVQLQVTNLYDSLVCSITAARTAPQPIMISLQVRGELQAIASGKLTDSLLVRFPLTDLSPGVAVITVFNEQLQILSSQPVFIRPQPLHISFSELKDQYAPEEQVTVKIKATDTNGQPVATMLSLRVHDQLFNNRRQVQDIRNHYTLSTQLHETLYDPGWYLDSLHPSHTDELNLLLQLAAPQRYPPTKGSPVLSDTLFGTVLPAGKQARPQAPVSLLVFNYNKSQSQLIAADNNGSFYLTTEQLVTGRRFFLKYLAEKEHILSITDPFALIGKAFNRQMPVFTGATLPVEIADKPSRDTGTFQYGHLLQEVVVKARGRGYGDRYLGYLDSIAKFEGNTDYVGQCGWLNCPACGSGKKPVEGVTYAELTEKKRQEVTSHPFSFGQGDLRMVTYKYPSYTEEELLKKFKMIMTKGFYQDRTFQSPDYSKDDQAASDMRNSLYWSPLIFTNEKGEATISFYTSDIRSGFTGIAEGISAHGALGVGKFYFGVR